MPPFLKCARHYHVPVIMVSGDHAATQEARTLLGKVEVSTVKWGIGRNNATCLSLPKAYEAIHAAIEQALTHIGSFQRAHFKKGGIFHL